LAPSVHNTQPWKVKIDKGNLLILVDQTRRLTHGDPTGRETYISLGIFTEACVLAMAHYGFSAQAPAVNGDSIVLKISKTDKSSDDSADIEALKRRFTDRTIYKPAELTAEAIARLDASWHTNNVEVICTADRQLINKTAELTRHALLLAFSNPAFRRELTDYFVDKPSVPYGIPLSTLVTNKLKARFVKRLINSGVNRKQEAQTEHKRWRSASGLVFILADGDTKNYWLESGRAYLRASLEIQKLGFNQATSAAIVEASDFHEDIEKLLGTSKRIQSVIRIGRGSKKKRPSGRLTPQELLVT
jgi:hypothetical protein